MKNILILLSAATLTAGLASAATINAAATLCPNTALLSTFLPGGANAGCLQQDKIWDNFSYTGIGTTAVPASQVSVTLGYATSPLEIHQILFAPINGATWTSAFNLGFTITVAAGQTSNPVIAAVKDQINSGLNPNGSVVNVVNMPSPGTAFTLSPSGTATPPASNETQQQTGLSATSLATSASFVPNNGSTLFSLDEEFTQRVSAVPEPGTLALLGAGLLAFALYRRKAA